MKNVVYLSFILVASYLLTGCINDDSKTFQIAMPDITIESASFLAYVGELTEISTPIKWAGTDSTNYDFLWTLNGEKIATDKELKYVFTLAGTSYLTFQMTDRSTELVYGKDFQLTVNSKFFLGWLILSEKEARSSLSFIHMQTYELYPDIYHALYPDEPLGSDPYRMEVHHTSSADQILVMQKGGPGLIELNGSNFQKVIRTEDEFIGERYPENFGTPVRVAYTHKGPELLLTDKGTIYSRQNKSTTAFQMALYSTVPYEYSGENLSFNYFTFAGVSNFQLMFDNTYRRWLAFYNTTTIDRMIPPFTKGYTDSPGIFDYCTGMPDDIDLVYAETCNEATNTCDLIHILKDKTTGVHHMQTTSLSLSTTNYRITVTNPVQRVFAPGYGIDDKTQYCLLRGVATAFVDSPHVFFNVGHKVYFYRWANDRIYLYKDFGTGENRPTGDIVCIHTNGNATQLGFAFSDGHFYICDISRNTIDGIARGDIDTSGDNQIEIQHYSGLGRIVHAAFKYGRSTNYLNARILY